MANNQTVSKIVFVKDFTNLPPMSFGEKDASGNWIFNGVAYVFLPKTEGEAYNTITKFHRVKSYFNALFDLSNGVYPFVEQGFCLRVPLEDLMKLNYKEGVATVDGSFYDGEKLPYIQGQRDGIWNMDWVRGSFIYGKQQFDSEHQEGEPEWIQKSRNTYWKAIYRDMIIARDPVKLLYYPDEPTIMSYMVERARIANISDLTERRAACAEGLANYLVAKEGHKIDRTIEAGLEPINNPRKKEADGIVDFKTDKIIPIGKLDGRTFKRMRHMAPAGYVTFTPENLQKEVALILNQNLKVVEVKQ